MTLSGSVVIVFVAEFTVRTKIEGVNVTIV